jgi:type IV secretory pathway TrbD component
MTIDNGKRKLFFDSKVGILAGFVATQVALGIVEWIGTIDFSTLPTWLATSAGLAAGAAVNAITAWAAKRDPGTSGALRTPGASGVLD